MSKRWKQYQCQCYNDQVNAPSFWIHSMTLKIEVYKITVLIKWIKHDQQHYTDKDKRFPGWFKIFQQLIGVFHKNTHQKEYGQKDNVINISPNQPFLRIGNEIMYPVRKYFLQVWRQHNTVKKEHALEHIQRLIKIPAPEEHPGYVNKIKS